MNREKVLEIYNEHVRSGVATAEHLSTLQDLAKDCKDVVEFGIKRGASSSALLLGCKGILHSWDLMITKQARALQRAAGSKWRVHEGNTLDIRELPKTDMIFFDSLHTYHQLREELAWGNHARKYLVFHDTITFGIWGADGEMGRWQETPHISKKVKLSTHGIRLAIDEFMVRYPHWVIKFHHPNSHGLLCLERK